MRVSRIQVVGYVEEKKGITELLEIVFLKYEE